MNKITTDECRNDTDHGVRLTLPDGHVMDAVDGRMLSLECTAYWRCEDLPMWVLMRDGAEWCHYFWEGPANE